MPEGFQVAGLCFKQVTIYLSDGVGKECRDVLNAFRVLAESSSTFIVCKKPGEVLDGVKTYVAKRGIRSRPWLKYAILTHDDAERERVLSDIEEPRLVQTLDMFLTTHALVKREAMCPGW